MSLSFESKIYCFVLLTNELLIYYKKIGSTVITPLLVRGSPLFPAIALCSPGEEVKLNLNLRWCPSSLTRSVSNESLMCIDSYEDDWMRLHDIRLNGNVS